MRIMKLIKSMPVVQLGSNPWKFMVIGPGGYQVDEIDNPTSRFGVKWFKTTIDGREYGTSKVVWEEYCQNGRR